MGLLATLCVWAFAIRINDQSQQLSLDSSFHVTARAPHSAKWYRNLDRQVLVFNDVKNSPHRGLITYHSHDVSRPLPGISIERSGPGISAWVSGSGPAQTNLPWFTVYVSLLYPIVLFAIAPLAWLLRRFKRAARGFPVVADPTAS